MTFSFCDIQQTGGEANDHLDSGVGTNSNDSGPGCNTCTNPSTGLGC
ncbi:hypothetical protein [Streptomyces siamensis]